MGSLKTFDLELFIKQYGCRVYIETGTGVCDCFSHAIQYPFELFYSIDVDGELINNAKRLYNQPNMHFLHDYTHSALKEILSALPSNIPVLFFLDAHFPGADFNKISYEESIRKFGEDAFPLMKEIHTIKAARDVAKDVFIIDDWKLYDKSLKCEVPNWEYRNLQEELGLITDDKLVINEFEPTHEYKINLKHQGYIVFTPKVL